jgi:hypothetical protein
MNEGKTLLTLEQAQERAGSIIRCNIRLTTLGGVPSDSPLFLHGVTGRSFLVSAILDGRGQGTAFEIPQDYSEHLYTEEEWQAKRNQSLWLDLQRSIREFVEIQRSSLPSGIQITCSPEDETYLFVARPAFTAGSECPVVKGTAQIVWSFDPGAAQIDAEIKTPGRPPLMHVFQIQQDGALAIMDEDTIGRRMTVHAILNEIIEPFLLAEDSTFWSILKKRSQL